MDKLVFDVNVAMHGYANEAEAAHKDAGHNPGQISSRSEAMRALKIARDNVIEMERERDKRRA